MNIQELEEFQKELTHDLNLLDDAIENLRDCVHGVGYTLTSGGGEMQKLIPTPWVNKLIVDIFPEYYTKIRPSIAKHLEK